MSGEDKSANQFGEFFGKLGEWGHVARSSRSRGDGLGWLERRPRLAAGLAYLGIGVGLVLAIVPGLYAIRSLTRWRRVGVTPDLAWNLALLGLWTVPAVLLWVSGLYLLAIFIPFPGWLFSISAIRR